MRFPPMRNGHSNTGYGAACSKQHGLRNCLRGPTRRGGDISQNWLASSQRLLRGKRNNRCHERQLDLYRLGQHQQVVGSNAGGLFYIIGVKGEKHGRHTNGGVVECPATGGTG